MHGEHILWTLFWCAWGDYVGEGGLTLSRGALRASFANTDLGCWAAKDTSRRPRQPAQRELAHRAVDHNSAVSGNRS